jgi:hypothetical protein
VLESSLRRENQVSDAAALGRDVVGKQVQQMLGWSIPAVVEGGQLAAAAWKRGEGRTLSFEEACASCSGRWRDRGQAQIDSAVALVAHSVAACSFEPDASVEDKMTVWEEEGCSGTTALRMRPCWD